MFKRIIYTCICLCICAFVQAQANDTLQVTNNDFNLQEVNVSARRSSVTRSRVSAFDTQKMNAAELCKAACCNLAESFETNASVDVAYADAATGAKQIRLLGLSGTYIQLLTENTQGIRGLAQSFGLEYIPGPWMESIQVSKGTASVLNGYEATTGQINVEYLKPNTQDPLAINLMLNSELHAEANLTGGWQVVKPTEENGGLDISTGLLAHGQYAFMPMDDNKDTFIDMPVGGQANLLNRWDIRKGRYTGRILLRGLYDQRLGGQQTLHHDFEHEIENRYKIDLETYRIEGFMKNGYVFDTETEMSIGIITAVNYHNQNNFYGNRKWNASQLNAYLNALYAVEFTEEHKLTAGLSLNYDRYDEAFINNETKDNNIRPSWELTPGIFAEYSFSYEEKLSLLLGLRGDYSTRYGAFVTPRMNIRYSPWEWWTLRASCGLGYRSPNILADNAFVLPSSRKLVFDFDKLPQEQALNTGISTTFYIPIGSRELQLSGEYYYTHFFNSLVIDMDTDPHAVIFQAQNGRSFAHCWQVEASMEILRGWTLTAAFRQTDVRQTINGQLREKPLTPKFKALITTSYQTPLKHWQFDVTAQFNGGGRLPDPDLENPLWNTTYSWYPQLMAQITKYWRKCSLYVGAENMTNYKQDNPIIAADQPFGNDFDASMVYAPISGWEVYVGFRWNLERKDD